jgi:hypothetical protein
MTDYHHPHPGAGGGEDASNEEDNNHWRNYLHQQADLKNKEEDK